MSSKDPKTTVLSNWPVLVALALVTLLVAGMLGLDLYFSEREASKTTDIIENAQRSITLLNNIRDHAKRLAATNSEDAIGELTRAIDEDARAYDPLATYQGEREEWTHLQGSLRELSGNPRNHQRTASVVEGEIDNSIDKLLSINSLEGSDSLASIRAAHRQALWSDAVVGGIVLATVALISFWLLRLLGRQRRLIVERVQLLDEKNRELEAFAGRAAHDLRSPMNPIRGYTDLILESPGLPEDVAGMAQRIRRAVDRMSSVVDNMLALSVSGRPPPGHSSSALVVERLVEEMGPELQGIDLATKLRGGRVACAEEVLAQILRNLIGNAIKFRAHSRPLRITIETRDVGPMVELAIDDNGLGMDSESARHAFEPFYRGQMDRELPGHGLGLAIVDRTIRSLGGTCELSSVLDHSTRIVVRLPRA
ncbi:MAG TPA: HAMP domain-containing sensor histidine kinase [Polyangia bacterium]|nr:HAMP domain-containing sensor histidine kinase [Polyangia bacterium]